MNIIAISCEHNAGVAAWKDGELVFMMSEEKFTNVKNQWWFPWNALRAAKRLLVTVDKVYVVSLQHQPYVLEGCQSAIMDVSRSPLRNLWVFFQKHFPTRYPAARLRDFLWERVGRKVRPQIDKAIGEVTLCDNVTYVDHHRGHARGVMNFYEIDQEMDLLAITIDGEGDGVCSRIFHYRAMEHVHPRLIASTPWDHTAGALIGYATRHLGMRALEHEYKVMGLAAWVKNERLPAKLMEELRKLIWVDEQRLQFRSSMGMYDVKDWWHKHGREVRFDLLSAAVQAHLEYLVCTLIRAAIRKTKVTSIAMSGGLFLNVKMNQKIAHLPEVTRCWFMPGAGDESLALGGPMLSIGGQIYTGLSYSTNEIRTRLEKEKLPYKFYGKREGAIEEELGHLLAEGQIVGRFTGRGEWGPRALGNRSILAHPGRYESFFRVNDEIKCRDFWMPFAPTIMEEDAPIYIKDWDRLSSVCPESLRYMTVCANGTTQAKIHLPAAYHHGDDTMRPQILRKQDNPSYYDLIWHFKTHTGIGALLNTSLNVHGYPLVGTLDQAIWTFRNSGLRHLAIGDFLISKNA